MEWQALCGSRDIKWIFINKGKLSLLYCHPLQSRPSTRGLCTSLNCLQLLPQSTALMYVAACLVSGSLCLFT